ncbi:MAG: hypothetical protein WC780_11710 [Lentimicrobiaceae bacterium]|jgi:hypothetical protein
MKKILLSTILVLLVLQGISQQSFRLHVQPGKPQLAGDGDDYTTLVITARDKEGEVITSMNGKVAVRVSSGFCEAIEVNMQDGVAMVKYTSPMFGTPIKASQRMVYFMFKFMQKFIARSGGSTDSQANQKLATDITIETFKEGLIPVTLIAKKDGDNFAYIVCEMNGVKGKAKIEILKASEGRNGSIVQGVYYGRDITGQSDWKLNIFSGGMGTWGEANASEDDYNTIMFSNEVFTEMNDVLGKTAGMTGFLKAYIGPSWKETKYIENFDIIKQGMGLAYMPMPDNGVFIYIPPILFEYQGRQVSSTSSSENRPEEVIKTDKSGIVLSQNEIIGDGKSRTRAVFHYQDENGIPVSGKSISWSIPNGIKQISVQTVTDANGNAETVLEAPVLKATGETRGENTGQIIDNYDLYKITVNYASPKRANDYTQAYLSVYKTIERNIRILKPGFEEKSFKILLPQLEQFKLQSSVYALIEMINSPSIPDKTEVNDAIVLIERKKFDQENYNRNYELYFKKDRKLFLDLLDNDRGGFFAITNSEGKFALNIGINPDKKLSMEPLQAKLSDLTGKRKGSLGSALKLFQDDVFTNQMIDALFAIDKGLCSLDHTKSVYLEEKLHILGNLMANTNSTSGMLDETTGEITSATWELLGVIWGFANDHYKITEGLSKKVKLDDLQGWAGGKGAEAVKYIYAKVNGEEMAGGVKAKMYKELYKRIFAESDKGKTLGTKFYYQSMGESVYNGISQMLSAQLGAISEYFGNLNPLPGGLKDFMKARYYGSLKNEVTAYMNTPPEKIHAVYEKIQPILRDRSTELRDYYSKVGKFRMDMGYYKADKDLFADLSKGVIIIGTVLITRDYARMVDLLDKLDKGSKVIDGLFAANNMANEMWSYSTMLAEVKSTFDFVNLSTSGGNVTLTPKYVSNGFDLNLFPRAYAQEVPSGKAIPGISALSAGDLSYGNPSLDKLYIGYPYYEAWFDKNKENLLKAGIDNNAQVAKLMKASDDYDRNLFAITMIDAALYNNPADPELLQPRAARSKQLASEIGSLIAEGSKTVELIDRLPKGNALGEVESTESKKAIAFTNNEIFIYGGAGLGGILIIIILVILIRRKRRSSISQNQYNLSPDSQSPNHQDSSHNHNIPNFRNPKSAIQNPPSEIVTPKFCPQCGATFKPEAKFCGKCGFRI